MGLLNLFNYELIKEKKGQAAPLLIMLIALVLVAMMVVFNTGKVALNRIDTQNASDAGALAAASWLASGQNYIADTSQVMFAASLGFISMMAILGWTKKFREPGGVAIIIKLAIAFSAFQAVQYILADRAGKQAADMADSQGKAYAFYNAGIDEYKVPEEGEDYNSYLERDSKFQQWIEAKGYEGGVYPSPGKKWEDTKYRYWDNRSDEWVTYKDDTTNEVKVDVDSPNSFTLIPMLLPGYSISWIEPVPHVSGWVAIPVPFIAFPAFIMSMSPSNPDVTVTTTRREPDADLGLWKLNMPDITSGSRAKTTGGGAIFITGGTYECELVEAW